ncbi:uncharacterized protein Dwil_GK20040 [Drosophila willistoni]|uniref:Uncharacterized protein n=1 Tax=Drosophila willistoni TaxID=7260 RepID=B4MSV3_DROWI|nr:uncharacterized protein Dwil_GK20040 [Drosophila willistoni]
MRQAESFLPPAGVLAGDKRPWETFDWPAERRRGIYRSWGQYFRNARMNTAAQKYFDKCIDEDGNGGLSKGDDYLALYLRSKFNRSVARTQEAYEDSQHAARVAGPNDAGINTELADTVYDLNRFEDNKRMLHDFVRKYVGTSVKPLEHRLRIVNENFDDCMGDDSLGTFLMENSAQLGGCFEQISREKSPPDLRPRWKILKELNECDVQSVCDKEEKLLSPLEMARRKRKTKIFYQNYLNRAWTDIFFLKTLRQNPNLLLDRYFGSPTKRGEYLNRSFERVKKFTKMLHSRSPMYNELHQRRGNPRMKSQLHESRRSINHLERRLVFATLPIERTYLLHELADRHVQQNHFVQCLSYAQKAIEEAEHCNSKIWQFLSTMQMAKSHAILHKYERQTEVLDAAYDLAKELKSPKLCTFIELCRMLNKDYITLRKMSQLVASKRLRYKMSNRSSGLSSSQHSSPSNASIVVQNIMA